MKRIYGLLLLILVLLLTACGKSVAEKWQEQYDLGMQYLTDGDYEAAIVVFTAAIEIDAKDIQAYTGLVQAYIGTGNCESAAAAAVLGAEALADSDQVQADVVSDEFTEALIILGELCLDEDQYESSITVLSLVIEINPKVWEAYEGLACAYELQEDFMAAVETLALGIDTIGYNNLSDNDQEWIIARYKVLAYVYIDIADYESAIDILEQGYHYTLDETIKELLEELKAENELVIWDDVVLEEMIREKLGLEGDVYVRDLDGIYSLYIMGNTHIFINTENIGNGKGWFGGGRRLYADGQYRLISYYSFYNDDGGRTTYTERGNIVSINVLKYFRNLKRVLIIANHITDISVVNELDLEYANFWANDISDLSPLEGIDNGGWEQEQQFLEIGDVVKAE